MLRDMPDNGTRGAWLNDLSSLHPAKVPTRLREAIQALLPVSGGAVIEPARKVFDVTDFEDNLVLDLVVASNSLILVTDDTDLTSLSPWNGRVLMRPHEFVNRQLQNLR